MSGRVWSTEHRANHAAAMAARREQGVKRRSSAEVHARGGGKSPSVQSVRRAAQLLQAIREQPRRLGELAVALGLHKSTASRILITLEREGLVECSGGTWRLTFYGAPVPVAVESDHQCRCTTVTRIVQFRPNHRRLADGGSHVRAQLKSLGISEAPTQGASNKARADLSAPTDQRRHGGPIDHYLHNSAG